MIEFIKPKKPLSEMSFFELIIAYRETNSTMKEHSIQYLYIKDGHKEKFEYVFNKYDELKKEIAIEIADRMSKDNIQ